jgi:hypothetical protein
MENQNTITVMIENGGFGSAIAGPIASFNWKIPSSKN